MKKVIGLLLLLFVFSKTHAQEVIETEISSKYLNKIQKVKIFIPETYFDDYLAFPIAVVLNSDALFDTYVATSKLFAKNDKAPSQIIVGISQEFKEFNYLNYGFDNYSGLPTQISSRTFGFIKNDLLQFLQENFRISNFKTIIGDKLTANFANYFMFEDQPVFNAYISLNPQFAVHMPENLKNYSKKLKNEEYYYYLSLIQDPEELDKNKISDANRYLSNTENNEFNYRFDNFDKVSELTSIPQGIASALEHVFTGYSGIDQREYENKVAYLSPLAKIEYLSFKYENIQYLFGEEKEIRVTDFYAIEDSFHESENSNYLEDLGEFALETHPKEPMGDYYLGRFYEMDMDYRKAAIHYKKGYVKIPSDSPESRLFYENIARVNRLIKEKT